MKIDIIGSVASGKTTFARALSETYAVPYYEKDNIVWDRTPNGDRKRTPEERDAIYREILESDHWIVEGSPRKVLKESFACCDYIILLDVGLPVRLYRVFRRWIRQRTGREPYNTMPTLNFLIYNIKWVIEYDRDRKRIIDELTRYKGKYKRFRNAADAMRFVEDRYQQRQIL